MERGKIKETHHKDDDEDGEEERNKIGLERDAVLARGDDKRKESKGKMRNCRSTDVLERP